MNKTKIFTNQEAKFILDAAEDALDAAEMTLDAAEMTLDVMGEALETVKKIAEEVSQTTLITKDMKTKTDKAVKLLQNIKEKTVIGIPFEPI